MNVSIGEKKAFSSATPCYKQLEDYRRCRGVTMNTRLATIDVVVFGKGPPLYSTHAKIHEHKNSLRERNIEQHASDRNQSSQAVFDN